MAIRKIYKVPESLPCPVRLFLDDIREILRIIEEVPWSPSYSSETRKLVFSTEEKECDSIEDLPNLGAKTSTFEIKYKPISVYV